MVKYVSGKPEIYKSALESLRFGMEKFNLLDSNATFVFSDKDLQKQVMKISNPELRVTANQIKLVENLNEFNKV